MATYQYNILLIPENEAFHKMSFPLEDDFDHWDYDWWKKTIQFKTIEPVLRKNLPEIKWTEQNQNLYAFGNEETNDVTVSLLDEKYIESFHVRIDLREIDTKFIELIIHLAQSIDCGFLDQQGNVFSPTFEQLKSSIEKSNAFKFVSDPNSFLSGNK